MLGSLVDYARRAGLVTEPGFAPKDVRWAILCGRDGAFLDVVELGDTAAKHNRGRPFPRCPELSLPEIRRGGTGCRPFLVDSADVVALLADGEPDGKVRAKHAYFAGLLRQASAVYPELAACAMAIEDPDSLAAIKARLTALKAKPTERVTFSLSESSLDFPVESDAWHDWWRGFRRSLGGEKPRPGPVAPASPAALVRCLASGELVAATPTQPKIYGLSDVGGLPMGDALASFKQESFCSYGFVQSANAPVSEEIAAAYRAALNHLLRETGERLAGTKVVHWFESALPIEEDPLPWLVADEADQERDARRQGRELLTAIRSGQRPGLLANRYHVLTLSGASGRVMVRDVLEGPFPELVENVTAWFDDLSIVRRDGQGLAPAPKIRAVLAALVRELKNLPGPLEARLWRAAVRCEPIPRQALAQALLRLRSDLLQNEPFHHARMGLLRAFLVRQGDRAMQPYLNEDHPDPAYHCGRLMALFAALQYRALGDVGAGVVQRYYAAASTTPALVLGRLTRTAQFHLDKLERPLARFYEGRIAEVWSRIHDRVPPALSLEQQTLFALGYYQQIAADRARPRSEALPVAADPSSASQETDHAHAD